MLVHFNSKIECLGDFDISQFSTAEIKKEPQFFSADLEFLKANGGPITLAFVRALEKTNWVDDSIVFDSRVHMLMQGWYPCIPGWHLDDVPRTREDGQPDHVHPQYMSEHVLALVGDCCKTEFALGSCQLEEPEIGKVVYGEWHKDLEHLLGEENSPLTRQSAEPGKLWAFNCQTWHRGTGATSNGWRWFGRISKNTERKVFNEIRTQTQVYLPCENEGW